MKIIDTYTLEYKKYLKNKIPRTEKERIVKAVSRYLFKRIRLLTILLVVLFVTLGIFVFDGLFKLLFVLMFPILFIFCCYLVIHENDYFNLEEGFKLAFSVEKINQLNKKKYIYGTNIHPKYLVGEFQSTNFIDLSEDRKILFNDKEFIITDKKRYSKVYLKTNVKNIKILEIDSLDNLNRKDLKKYKNNIVICIRLVDEKMLNIIFKNNVNVGLKEIEKIAISKIEEFKKYIKINL